jgi:hypothetical protein
MINREPQQSERPAEQVDDPILAEPELHKAGELALVHETVLTWIGDRSTAAEDYGKHAELHKLYPQWTKWPGSPEAA